MTDPIKPPDPPDGLAEHGREFWRRIVTRYQVEEHHFDMLTQACECLDLAEACRERIAADGLVVEDRFEQDRAHPLLNTERDARNAFCRIYRALKLDEEDRRPPGRPPGWSPA